MGSQVKLTALLHELQRAHSPLAQARVLARSWRTLRELSPTDRRLLARHAGFEGAEEILEGLGQRGGLAPAMLLRVLANARSTDDSAVSELLAAIRRPGRRGEAISRGAELAADLLAEPGLTTAREEVEDALGELPAAEETMDRESEEVSVSVDDLGQGDLDGEEGSPEPELEAGIEEDPGRETVADSETALDPETELEPEEESEPEPLSEAHPAPPALPPPEPVVDWGRWHSTRESSRPAPHPRPGGPPSVPGTGTQRPDIRAVIAVMADEASVLSRLRRLRRELSAFQGSSTATLFELVDIFPDGWVRRRALCALLDEGVVSTIDDALELVSKLGRESDRRWCLGVLARQGGLSGASLDRALALVASPASQRRLRLASRS